MHEPWLVIFIGAVCVIVPLMISRWHHGNSGQPGGVRDRVHSAVQSEDGTAYFFTGMRIGIEIAGVILIAIGVMRMVGVQI